MKLLKFRKGLGLVRARARQVEAGGRIDGGERLTETIISRLRGFAQSKISRIERLRATHNAAKRRPSREIKDQE